MLQGKVIIVMGGTTGLGRSGAAACVAAGARVLVVGRDQADGAAAEASLGPNSAYFPGDAADSGTAGRAIAAARAAWGRFDGLYHVAGGSGRAFGDGPLHQIPDEAWRQTVAWNLDSVFYSNRAALSDWMERESPGVLLNMASVLAFSPSPTYFTTHAYASAKAAIIGMSRALAAYYAPRGIRCNVLAPGLVETPMAQRAASDPQIRQFIATKQPLDGGRIGVPADLDAAVVFLLSDASRFMTGQVLAIDGGWSVSEGQSPAVSTTGNTP